MGHGAWTLQGGRRGGKEGRAERGMLSSPCLPEAQALGLGLSRPEGTLGEQGESPLTLPSRLPFSLWIGLAQAVGSAPIPEMK